MLGGTILARIADDLLISASLYAAALGVVTPDALFGPAESVIILASNPLDSMTF